MYTSRRDISLTLPLPAGALLTYVEAALTLGVSVSSIRDYVARGILGAKWLTPRAVRVPHSEILRLRDERAQRGRGMTAELVAADHARRVRNGHSKQEARARQDHDAAIAALIRGNPSESQLSLIQSVIGGAL